MDYDAAAASVVANDKVVQIKKAYAKAQARELQQQVNISANPSPAIVACIVIMILFVIYLIHVSLIPGLNGTWIDESDIKRHINHNSITGSISSDSDSDIVGSLIYGVLKINGRQVLWDNNNTIYFIKNNQIYDTWRRLV